MWNEELSSNDITKDDKDLKCVTKSCFFQLSPGENMLVKFFKVGGDDEYEFFTFKSVCQKVETELSKKVNKIKDRVRMTMEEADRSCK